MGDDIGSGLSSMAVCFDFCSTNVVQLSNRNMHFYRFQCHHSLITQLTLSLSAFLDTKDTLQGGIIMEWKNFQQQISVCYAFYTCEILYFGKKVWIWDYTLIGRLHIAQKMSNCVYTRQNSSKVKKIYLSTLVYIF
jgi:hypothetical protein